MAFAKIGIEHYLAGVGCGVAGFPVKSRRLGEPVPTSVMRLCVADNGPGIAGPNAERVFQDGYSTKTGDSGTRRGLGLALVHRMVHRAGGSIALTPGPATRFEVWLPERSPGHQATASILEAST